MERDRLIFTVLLGFSLFFSISILYSQNIDADSLSPDFNSLESYLDAADRRCLQQQWLDYARFGMRAVMASWEKEVLLLAGDDNDTGALRQHAEAGLNRMITERFARWLNRQFFNNISVPSIGKLSTEIDRLNNLYLYEQQPDGSRKYKTTVNYDDLYTTDDSGTASLVRKGEKSLWTDGVKTKITGLLSDWSAKITTAFSELRSSVPDEALVDELDRAYSRSFEDFRNQFRTNLYRLYHREQSRFASLRLFDQYSLQRESEEVTAAKVTEQLITRTKEELDAGLAVLMSGLQPAAGDVKPEGVIEAGQWRDAFRALLEQGLHSWDSAEEELLMERVRWEQDAGAEVSAGEEVWAGAFNELKANRSEWMIGFRKTLEEGNRLWAEETEELNEAIGKAVAELDQNIEASEASLQGRIDNLVGMLLQSVNMMRTARSSWEYWMDRFDEGEKGSFDAGGADFDADSMMNLTEAARPALSGAVRDENSAYKEALYWLELFRSYQNYAADSQERLAETYGIVVFDNPSLKSAFMGENISEALMSRDILLDERTWESLYLDEFQVELLKARAYMQYWNRAREVAQAVYDYAADNSSNKENAEITAERLTEAKTAYETVLSEYSSLLDELGGIGTDLESLQMNMNTIRAGIDGYQQQLADARKEYNMTISDLGVDNPQYLAEQYREHYLQLLMLMGMDGESECGPGRALENYLLAASEYGLENEISLVSKLVVERLSGAESTDMSDAAFNPETASLAELRRRMTIVTAAGFKAVSEDDFFNLSEGGIDAFTTYLENNLLLSMNDYHYKKLVEYYNLYTSGEKGEILWEMTRIADELKARVSLRYETRLAELKLLTSDDFSAWALQYFDTGLAEEITAEVEAETIEFAIAYDVSVYEQLLRLYETHDGPGKFSIRDWNVLLSGEGDPADPLYALQQLWDIRRAEFETDAGTAEYFTDLTQSLKNLSGWLSGLGGTAGNIDRLENVLLNPDESLGQQHLKRYLSGTHHLGGRCSDLYPYLNREQLAESGLKTAIASMLKQNLSNAPSLAAWNYERSRNALINELDSAGLIDPDSMNFINPAAVWEEAAFSGISDIIERFAALKRIGSGLDLPEYLAGILNSYVNELKDYFSVRTASTFGNELSPDLESVNNEIKAQTEKAAALNALLQSLRKNGDDAEKLYEIAAAGEVEPELRAAAEKQFYETAGFDLAGIALMTGGFDDTGAAWKEIFDEYISGFTGENGMRAFSEAVLQRASELYTLASVLQEPEGIDWAGAPQEQLEIYRAMIWNSLDFKTAAGRITGAGSQMNISELEQARLIDSFLPEQASDFPDDAELQWLYKGNEILREVDGFITSGAPLLWAAEGFSPAESVKDRYFTAAEIEEYESILTLTAADSAAGLRLQDKALLLWNSDFSAAAESGSIGGILQSFTVLVLINGVLESAGAYSADFTYTELLERLTGSLSFSEQQRLLYADAAAGADAALESFFEELVTDPPEPLCDDELYWNLLWSIRRDAAADNYSVAAAREAYIFDDPPASAVVERWLESAGGEYGALSDAVKSAVERQIPETAALSGTEAGGIYAEISAMNAAALLTESFSYSIDAACSFVNWYAESAGIGCEIEVSDLNDYLDTEESLRLYRILDHHPEAAVHYFKKQIASGEYTRQQLSSVLARMNGLSNQEKQDLKTLASSIDSLDIYNPVLHGSFEDFIGERYKDEKIKRRMRELRGRFMGGVNASWDDPIFTVSAGSRFDAAVILENLQYNRTRARNESGLNPDCGISVNDVFISEAARLISDRLYNGDDSLTAAIDKLKIRRELNARASVFLMAAQSPDDDSWRSFLNSEYLNSEDDELELMPGSKIDADTADYQRNLQIAAKPDGSSVSAPLEKFSELTVFCETGSDSGNLILDAANSYLDHAAYLAAALNSWMPGIAGLSDELAELNTKLGSAPDEDFWTGLGAASFGELLEAYGCDVDAAKTEHYEQKRAEFRNFVNGIEALKTSMGNFGNRREKLIRMRGMGNAEQIAELKPLTERISGLENQISAAQADWQRLIDGDDGYRIREAEYAQLYEQLRSAADMLDAAKHDYSLARAIYEYASAGYLRIDDEILTEFDLSDGSDQDDAGLTGDGDGTDPAAVDAGITGGTIVASDIDAGSNNDEQKYRDSLLAKINKVSPAERLAYVDDKFTRAAAAYDALVHIIGNSGTDSIYLRDEVYRTHFDTYLKTFRESLVLNKINHVLNKAIARQEAVTRDALADWKKILCDSYVMPALYNQSGEAEIPPGLEELKLSKNSGGRWIIGWDGASAAENGREALIQEYFSPDQDSETRTSSFENDLMLWLEEISEIQKSGNAKDVFTTWAMARKWELYESDAAGEEIEKEIENHLNRNGEDALDRTGAKAVLLQKWKEAYNEVRAYTGNEKHLYNFYKLLDKGGIMQLDTVSAGAGNLELLAEEESVKLANQYMADKYHKGAKDLIISSIPMFAMAAVYWALAAAAVFIFMVGPIISAALVAVAVGLTIGASLLVGEGNMKIAAANDIRKNIVSPAEKNMNSFISSFRQNTAGILDKKQVYELEYEKLGKMKGDAPEGEVLSDAERINRLTQSAVKAFAEENEDLHGLLVKARLVPVSGNKGDDTEALKSLFGSYQQRMSLSVKAQCTNSSRMIAALENESQEYKQNTARELNDYLTKNDGAARRQNKAEEDYRRAYYRYISGELELEDYEDCAEAAWKAPVFSAREHLLRLYEGQNGIAEMIMGNDQFSADVGSELLESQKMLLIGSGGANGIYDYRMSNYRKVKLYQMDMLRLEISEKRKQWENQMRAITARGELEWSAGERRFNRKYKDWRKTVLRTYNRQKDAWDEKYLDFLDDKQRWLDSVSIQSRQTGETEVLENFGGMTSASIAAAGADIIITEMESLRIDPDEVLNDIVDFELLGTLLENAASLNESITGADTVIFTRRSPEKFTSADSLQSIKNFQSLKNEEYEKHLAEIEITRLFEQVEEAEENFIKSIDAANKNIAGKLHKSMRSDGYIKSGNRYERRLVVGATTGEYIYEDGYVSAYSNYSPGPVDFSEELEDAVKNKDTMDAGSLKGLVARVLEKIGTLVKKIFGEDEDTNAGILTDLGLSGEKADQGKTIAVKRQDVSVKAGKGVIEGAVEWIAGLFPKDSKEAGEVSPDASVAQLSPGYFGAHIGYAPVLSPTADKDKAWNAEGQLKYKGLGQMGRIFGEFQINKLKENAGWEEVNTPHYKKKLWDSPYAPSTADLCSIGTGIVTMGAAGGMNMFISAGMNLVDDLAVSAFDVGTGERTLSEGAVDFGRNAATALLGAAGGEAFRTAELSGMGWEEKLLLSTGRKAYNNLTGSAINAISYEDGEWDCNLNTFEQGLFGTGAIAGYVGGAMGTAAETGLNSLVKGSWTSVEQAFYGSSLELGRIAAETAGEYAVYAASQLAKDGFGDVGSSMTKAFDSMDLSLNVLDLGSILDAAGAAASVGSNDYSSDFLSELRNASEKLNGMGLFALNINSRGIHGRITSGGKSIGNSLYNLGKGFTADMAIRHYDAGGNKGAELFNAGYAHGDQSFEDTIWRVLAGKDSLHFDTDEGEAETIRKTNGGRSIHMDKKYEDATGSELLKGAVVLQHEAHRNGLIGILNDEETMKAVTAHTEMALGLAGAYGIDFMAGDANLAGDIAAYMTALRCGSGFDAAAFAGYIEGNYDSSADYWKLVENPDGSLTIHDDGRGGVFYTDEKGEEHEIGHYLSGSRTEHLQKILGLNLTKEEKARLNSEMLVGLGSAETYNNGHFLDIDGKQISIDLTGEWADRMGAALDYNRMFVDAWRNDGTMDTMLEKLRYMNISEKYGADYSDRQKYLVDMYDKAVDFSSRFNAGTAIEHLFSQTEIENKVGFGKNALCYGTVPVNLYQLRDPSISLDMVGDALLAANSKRFIQDDGTIDNYSNYLKLLGKGFNSSQYLSYGSDFYNKQDYSESDYTIADLAAYGYNKDEEHHTLYRSGYSIIDPFKGQLSWNDVAYYRFRALEWRSWN